jgi:hypothetical protein
MVAGGMAREAKLGSRPPARVFCQTTTRATVCSSLADTRRMSPINTAFPSFSLPTAQNSGRAALATGTQQLNQDAQQIADPAEGDVTTPLLDSSQSLLLAQAGAQVIRTSNQNIGTLLDIFA